MRLFGTKKTQTLTNGDGWSAAYLARAERDNALDDLDQAVRERKLAIRERDAARKQRDDLIAKLNLPKVLHCSFCGKSHHEVRKMIAGPTVFICDECVELCMDIIREKEGAA